MDSKNKPMASADHMTLTGTGDGHVDLEPFI
jgi:hypothetical protein